MTYLLTFNCYGTYLPGEVGWVERARGNHRGGYHDPRFGLARHARQLMIQEPYLLDLPRSRIVLDAIRETCRFRDWALLAAHVRTTHVHLVVNGLSDPDRTIAELKSYASRALSQAGFETNARKRWARGGSTRYLRDARAINAAIKYVADQLGVPMAVYWNDKCDPAVSPR